MGIFRLYTGEDGQSHIEEQTLGSHPVLGEPQAAEHILFRELPPGTFMDWHCAPRRQYVVVLSGRLEIGLGDGSLWRLGPGDATLASDTSGQGHTTRAVGSDPVVVAVVPLAGGES